MQKEKTNILEVGPVIGMFGFGGVGSAPEINSTFSSILARPFPFHASYQPLDMVGNFSKDR